MTDTATDAVPAAPAAETPPPLPPPAPAANPQRPPWGFWMTALWGLLSLTVWMVAQIGVLMAIVAGRMLDNPDYQPDLANVATLGLDGRVFSITTFIATPVSLAVFLLPIWLRRWRIADYLALKLPRRQDVVVGVFLFVVITLICDSATYISGRPLAQEFAAQLYTSSKVNGALIWLALAVIVVAPIGEELWFRGFFFRGWSQSRIGVALTILLTSLVWTSMHVQYDWFFQTQVFVLGILFGWLRWSSGSTLLTIMLHMMANLEASLVTAAVIEWHS